MSVELIVSVMNIAQYGELCLDPSGETSDCYPIEDYWLGNCENFIFGNSNGISSFSIIDGYSLACDLYTFVISSPVSSRAVR